MAGEAMAGDAMNTDVGTGEPMIDPELWDLAVVGAGPAGSAAALAALRARPQARVLLLDAAGFPRDKVCGDGIAPHAVELLAGLGVDPVALVAGTAPVTRLRLVSPGGTVAARALARPAAVVPRRLLDERIVRAAVGTGAVLRRHRVRTVVCDSEGVTLDGVVRARVVVAADGAESVLRRAVGARPAPTGTIAVALRAYAPSASLPAGEQLLTMTRAHWPAYAWAFPIGDGSANVGYGELLQGSAPTRAQLLARMHDLLPWLADHELVALRGHRLPLSNGRPAVAAGRVLLAGDAASLINPITGEGIYYAVLSGAFAGAAAVGAGDPATAYRRALRAALGRHLRHTDVLARLGRWPALLDLGIAAASDAQPVFDDLVELGLGRGRITARTVTGLSRPLTGSRRGRPQVSRAG